MTSGRALGKGLASLIPIKEPIKEEKEESEIPSAQNISHISGELSEEDSSSKVIKKASTSDSEALSLAKIERPNDITNDITTEKRGSLELAIGAIFPSRSQPRKMFNKTPLAELAASIQEQGIIQPLIVKKAAEGKYELVAGERRLRASKMIGLKTIPVVVTNVEQEKVFELALIENIQREDLNPIEEALAYRELQERYQFTQEQIAQRVGKDRSSVANLLRLLQLPKEVRAEIIANRLSMGHARALLGLEQDEDKIKLKNQILKDDLSVRETEEQVQKIKAGMGQKLPRRAAILNPQHRYLEEKMTQKLGTKVSIQNKGLRGKIVIEYYQPEELDRLYEILTH